MSFQSQQFLRHLQAANHSEKRRYLMIGSAIVFLLVVVGFFVFRFIRVSPESVSSQVIRPDFSFSKSLIGGGVLFAQGVSDVVRGVGGRFTVSEKQYTVTPSN